METAASNANSYMPPSLANATIRLAIIKAKKFRSRLAKISSSMAQEIVENRAERL